MRRVPVDELIAVDESGFACSKSKLVVSGLPHLRPFNISDDGNIDLAQLYQVPVDEAPRGKSSLEGGDILFNNTNSTELVGKSALIGSSMMAGFSNHMTRIRVNKALIEPAFFAYWLRRLRSTGHFTAKATQWVSQASYRTSDLRKLDVDLPTLPEQRRIVDILSRAEGIVRLRREAQKKAAEITHALFVDTFGDPATNPKEWPIITIGDIIHAAQDGPHVSPNYVDNGIPFLSTRHIKRGQVIFQDLKYLSLQEAETQWKKCKPVRGDVLYTKGGTTGLAAEITFDTEIAVWVHVALLKTNHEKVSPTWLESMLNSEFCYRQSQELTHGIANRDLGLKRMGTIRAYLPPLELQKEFANRVEQIRSIQSQQSAATAKAEAIFEALLGHAFAEKGN